MAISKPQTPEERSLYKKLYEKQKALIRNNFKPVSELTVKEQETIITSMLKTYESYSAADAYIVGFIYQQQLYKLTLTAGELSKYVKLDAASRGGGYSLRFSPSIDMKKEMIKLVNTQPLNISVEDLANAVNQGITDDSGRITKNRGHFFERVITKLYNQQWYVDNIPFYEQGDLVDTVTNQQFQIKFEGATLTNQRSLERITLMRRLNFAKAFFKNK